MGKEQTIIVNEFDKTVGYKNRDELTKNDIYRVSVLWITNSDGKILLAKRSINKKNNPGKWGPAVGGTLEKGETYYSNIIKEAKEEIGLTDIYPVKGDKDLVKEEYTYFRQWHHININKKISEFKLKKDEVDEIKWFTKEELLNDIKKKPKNFVSSVIKMSKAMKE